MATKRIPDILNIDSAKDENEFDCFKNGFFSASFQFASRTLS